jgi:hypothetical protein
MEATQRRPALATCVRLARPDEGAIPASTRAWPRVISLAALSLRHRSRREPTAPPDARCSSNASARAHRCRRSLRPRIGTRPPSCLRTHATHASHVAFKTSTPAGNAYRTPNAAAVQSQTSPGGRARPASPATACDPSSENARAVIRSPSGSVSFPSMPGARTSSRPAGPDRPVLGVGDWRPLSCARYARPQPTATHSASPTPRQPDS